MARVRRRLSTTRHRPPSRHPRHTPTRLPCRHQRMAVEPGAGSRINFARIVPAPTLLRSTRMRLSLPDARCYAFAAIHCLNVRAEQRWLSPGGLRTQLVLGASIPVHGTMRWWGRLVDATLSALK